MVLNLNGKDQHEFMMSLSFKKYVPTLPLNWPKKLSHPVAMSSPNGL